MKNALLIFSIASFLVACQPSPEPLALGQDACAHCKMSIVDEQFAAELVSSKAKVFKYDAIECMLAYLSENAETDFSLYLIRDFESPKEWRDATQSWYLVSKEIPSPMGGYLSAWTSEQRAKKMQANKGGEVYNWAELVTRFEE